MVMFKYYKYYGYIKCIMIDRFEFNYFYYLYMNVCMWSCYWRVEGGIKFFGVLVWYYLDC